MNKSIDKLITHAAYWYIIAPFLIFVAGWLQPVYATLASVVLLASYALSVRATTQFRDIDFGKYKNKIAIALGIILVVLFFSGIGAFGYQNDDHCIRNGIFRDLISHKWPFMVNEGGNILYLKRPILFIYYFHYWLPAALIGKLWGWTAANVFLYLWSAAGMALTYYFLCRLFNKVSIRLLLILLFFNSLYLFVTMARYPVKTILTSDGLIWSDQMILAGSSLDSVFWIYNQVITPWLILAMILNNLPKQNVLFLYALCFIHGPFMCMGFFPFLGIMILKDLFGAEDAGRPFWKRVQAYLSVQNTIGMATILVLGYLFISGSSNVQKLYVEHIKPIKYLIFITVSFGIIAVLLFNKYKKEPVFYVIVAMLLTLPLLGMGTVQTFTFCARVSLAPMFMLMILTARYVFEEGNSMTKKMVVGYILLSAIEPGLELARNMALTIGFYANRAGMNQYLYKRSGEYSLRQKLTPPPQNWAEANFLNQYDLKSIDDSAYIFNRLSIDQKDSTFFNKHLLKKR